MQLAHQVVTVQDYAATLRNGRHPINDNRFDVTIRPPPGSGITDEEWNRPNNRLDKVMIWANHLYNSRNNR